MFKFVTFVLLVAAVHSSLARPQDAKSSPPVPIVSQTQSLDGTGAFQYAFESGDGVKEEGSGMLKNIKVPVVDPKTGETTGEQEGQGEQ